MVAGYRKSKNRNIRRISAYQDEHKRLNQMQAFKMSNPTDTSMEDCTELILDLLSYGQTLCKQTHSIGERLCKEVVRVTQGRARLLIPCLDSSIRRDAS